jgi:uncharacterized membrane protein YgcG
MRSVLAAAGLLLLHVSVTEAQVRDIAIEDFHARLEVRRAGGIDVTEVLRVRFTGSWNGIERDISTRHEVNGQRARLRLEDIRAADESGRPLETELSTVTDARRLRIWVPGAADATRTVVIRYRVPNALRFFDVDAAELTEGNRAPPFDELYWNVTGNLWEMPIEGASAEIVLPAGVAGVEAYAYTGPAGSTSRDADVEVVDTTVRIAARSSFAPGEGLTVSVSWLPGVVARPSAAARTAWLARMWWPLALPFLALFGMFRRWSRVGRDPEARAIVVQYAPPEDLSPAEVGTLVDHKAEMHELTATLVDLAVRGFVAIEEREEKRLLGLTTSTEYYFHLVKDRGHWSGLRAHERRFLDALFSFNDAKYAPATADIAALESVHLDALKDKFYRRVSGIRDAIYDRLVERGYYQKRPDRVKGRYLVAAMVLAIFGAGALGTAAEGMGLASSVAMTAGFVGAGGIIALFGLAMPARTVTGARAREGALGFREFLSRVETPRFDAVITSPALFERFLPYAMAFRVEDRWSEAFEELVRTPPSWYYGGSQATFRPRSFTRSLHAMSTSASRTMSSSPSSSGSGGGGRSGGGSGGGGGRGF